MCFSLQRRAIFPHLNFKKWSEHLMFLAFWLANVLRATAACNFSTSELQKVVRSRQFFSILTWKCASRYSGVQFFHIATSKSGPSMPCFVHFDFKMCFSLQPRAIFRHRNFKKWSAPELFLCILTWKCASRYSGVQFFMSPLNSYLRTRRFSEVTFRPSRQTNHWKTQHFATSLTFRACASSFYFRAIVSSSFWLYFFSLLFHLLTLLLCSAFSTVHIVGS